MFFRTLCEGHHVARGNAALVSIHSGLTERLPRLGLLEEALHMQPIERPDHDDAEVHLDLIDFAAAMAFIMSVALLMWIWIRW